LCSLRASNGLRPLASVEAINEKKGVVPWYGGSEQSGGLNEGEDEEEVFWLHGAWVTVASTVRGCSCGERGSRLLRALPRALYRAVLSWFQSLLFHGHTGSSFNTYFGWPECILKCIPEISHRQFQILALFGMVRPPTIMTRCPFEIWHFFIFFLSTQSDISLGLVRDCV
jgi:hypothetical protein